MPKRKKTESSPSVEIILQQSAQLEVPKLKELFIALEALLEVLENHLDLEAVESEVSKPHCGSRGGSTIEWKHINGYGPYPYLRFRSGGKYRSYYLKDLPSPSNLT